jgi:hypothetical protein
MSDAPEVKEEEQMSDAPPTVKDDEQMSDAPAIVSMQKFATAASEIDASQIVEERMEDAPVSVPEEDMKDVPQAPVDEVRTPLL